jgi:serine/threonine-protein phosphatase 2B regulatory subunit
MGATLSTAELEDIEKRTHFSRKQILRMHKRFMAMDSEKQGFVTLEQFALLPELCCNPLVERITASFDVNKVCPSICSRPHVLVTHIKGQQN